jgi:hypothetical protein
MGCIDPEILIDEGVNRILTQYRESPNLLFLMRNYLRTATEVHTAICSLPEYFDLNTATGDQLTLLGKRMGFPRCHCICNVTPVFGFACDGVPSEYPIVGFCDGGTWVDCGENGISDICIDDDETYRKFLLVRRYQMMRRYSLEDLTTALQIFYGPSAMVLDAGHGRVVLAPFRELTALETSLLQVVTRVLPIAPGIRTRFHFGTFKVFGFGEGWGGFCEVVDAGSVISTESGPVIWTEGGDTIAADAYQRHSDWMCAIDVKPYSC